MHPSDALLSAGCSSPRCLRCFSSQQYSVWCTVSVIARLKLEFNNRARLRAEGVPMPQETETQVVGNAPLIHSAFNESHRARPGSLAAGIALLAVSWLLVSRLSRRA